MKIAVPVWNDYVSTVLDFAECLLIAECKSEKIRHQSVVDLAGTTGAEKAVCIRNLGIQVLLCGAVSRPMERMITAGGIEVIPFLRGRVDVVIDAYLTGHLFEPGFMLPGCRRVGGYGQGNGMGHGRHGGCGGRGRGGRRWNI